MAIYFEIEYGGAIIGSVPITITPAGIYVKTLISANSSEASQISHTWKNLIDREIDSVTSTVDSTVDQPLRIIVRVDSEGDFPPEAQLALRSAVVEWLYIDVGEQKSYISFAELEVVMTAAFVSFAELETSDTVSAIITQVEFVLPLMSSDISFVALEVPIANVNFIPSVATLNLAGNQPSSFRITPAVASLTLTGTVANTGTITPSRGSLSITGTVPLVLVM